MISRHNDQRGQVFVRDPPGVYMDTSRDHERVKEWNWVGRGGEMRLCTTTDCVGRSLAEEAVVPLKEFQRQAPPAASRPRQFCSCPSVRAAARGGVVMNWVAGLRDSHRFGATDLDGATLSTQDANGDSLQLVPCFLKDTRKRTTLSGTWRNIGPS